MQAKFLADELTSPASRPSPTRTSRTRRSAAWNRPRVWVRAEDLAKARPVARRLRGRPAREAPRRAMSDLLRIWNWGPDHDLVPCTRSIFTLLGPSLVA